MLCGSTPGMDALGLKFAAVEKNMAMKSLLKALSVFSLLQVVLPAAWTKVHRLAATQRWNRLSAAPLQKNAWSIMLHADKAAVVASLANMVRCCILHECSEELGATKKTVFLVRHGTYSTNTNHSRLLSYTMAGTRRLRTA